MINAAASRARTANWRQIQVLDQVRTEVASAFARTHARFAQIDVAEQAVRSGQAAFSEDLHPHPRPRGLADRSARQLAAVGPGPQRIPDGDRRLRRGSIRTLRGAGATAGRHAGPAGPRRSEPGSPAPPRRRQVRSCPGRPDKLLGLLASRFCVATRQARGYPPVDTDQSDSNVKYRRATALLPWRRCVPATLATVGCAGLTSRSGASRLATCATSPWPPRSMRAGGPVGRSADRRIRPEPVPPRRCRATEIAPPGSSAAEWSRPSGCRRRRFPTPSRFIRSICASCCGWPTYRNPAIGLARGGDPRKPGLAAGGQRAAVADAARRRKLPRSTPATCNGPAARF